MICLHVGRKSEPVTIRVNPAHIVLVEPVAGPTEEQLRAVALAKLRATGQFDHDGWTYHASSGQAGSRDWPCMRRPAGTLMPLRDDDGAVMPEWVWPLHSAVEVISQEAFLAAQTAAADVLAANKADASFVQSIVYFSNGMFRKVHESDYDIDRAMRP